MDPVIIVVQVPTRHLAYIHAALVQPAEGKCAVLNLSLSWEKMSPASHWGQRTRSREVFSSGVLLCAPMPMHV